MEKQTVARGGFFSHRSVASGLEKPLLAGYLNTDDLVIFSRSGKGLQHIFLISKLESFCDFADLDVNIDKTKVMIFNDCGKSLNNYSFRYGALN